MNGFLHFFFIVHYSATLVSGKNSGGILTETKFCREHDVICRFLTAKENPKIFKPHVYQDVTDSLIVAHKMHLPFRRQKSQVGRSIHEALYQGSLCFIALCVNHCLLSSLS